ncbi:MAG: hypothetical protein HZC17_00210 [Candidatus Omnitrophica bacterium]|nr:hypothetical protein [Candidatus Omnitrophota bacterium]
MKYQMRKGNNPESRSYSHLFIYKPIQRQYFIWMAVITIVAAFVISFVVHQTVRSALSHEIARTTKLSVIEILNGMEYDLLINIFVVLFIAVIVSAIISVFFLHRIVGPIYRIQETLKKMADGQIPDKDIKLRPGDFFSELAAELNRALARYRSK